MVLLLITSSKTSIEVEPMQLNRCNPLSPASNLMCSQAGYFLCSCSPYETDISVFPTYGYLENLQCVQLLLGFVWIKEFKQY